MKTIASRQNPTVRRFRDLADRPDPQGQRLLLDGAHLVREAMDAGFDFEEIGISSSHLDRDSEEGTLARSLEQRGIAIVAAPDQLIGALSPVRTPSGIVAIARRHQPMPGPEEILRGPTLMVVVGVDIQEPGNVGALVRVAEAAGAAAVFVAGNSANPFSWKALRGSMGSGLRLPIVHGQSASDVMRLLRTHDIRSIAAVADGGSSPDDVRWTGKVAVVLGGEGPGLSDAVVAACDEQATIPMAAPVESLNVTVAAAILLYAARRQRETT